MERNCWRIVNGTETKPEDENYKELRDFNSRKDKAYSTIYLNVSKAYRCVIDDIEDPVAAWKRLEEHFRPNSRSREEIGIYAARIRSIVDQLKDAGKPISEWYQAFQLIRFLPPEFNGIVQYIYRWDDNEFKFDKILQELIAEESRLKQSIKDQKVIWERKAVPRKDRFRTDIYYYIQGSKDRFHCYKDIEEYCKTHNLEYDKALFNFSGKDKYSGIVTMEEANQSD
ncbi:hypothetical protein AVEN_218414-1 [Araneus ventricosus]|uniref:Uncharacterized protein n=1 Tax=Araneus ventricosus TaxID=182803 RepID=A0A4Y2S180_ARAVE|nr:hypothetical protein AVEN_161112-1 [Araneus ventricosus]GBN81931.1 hypothetical protein AVEN_180515-1 [Araneus ventricosus]GBN81937.1 hypothetical protein AVEN_189279-1 [Araneus ventricosus]GBN81949.1 hypothetical protein AVEN_218414-1 [Araneus ventricosus]